MPNYIKRTEVCLYLAGESVKIRYAAHYILWSIYSDENGRYKGKVVFYVN